MNPNPTRRHRQHLMAAALSTLLLMTLPAAAGPGAHGPNGEHLDAPAPTRAAAALPRLETHSESFELVAELRSGELVILIDRYESNEPVLGARLEVDSGALKAQARFRAEQGDYAVTDAALLKALAAPGEHALVFTLVAGAESDLLDGTLGRTVPAGPAAAASGQAAGSAHGHDHDHDHDHHGLSLRAKLLAAGIAGLSALAALLWWRQRRRPVAALRGGL